MVTKILLGQNCIHYSYAMIYKELLYQHLIYMLSSGSRKMQIRATLSNSFGFGGTNASLLVVQLLQLTGPKKKKKIQIMKELFRFPNGWNSFKSGD